MENNIYLTKNKVTDKQGVHFDYRLPIKEDNEFYFEVGPIDQVLGGFPKIWELPHSFKFYLMLWYSKGIGRQVINGQEYEMKDNRVFFINPSQTYTAQYDPDNQATVLYFSEGFLHFMEVVLSNHFKYDIFGRFEEKVYCDIPPSALPKLSALRQALTDEVQHGKELPDHHHLVASLFTTLLIEMERKCQWSQNVGYNIILPSYQAYLKFIKMVDQNYRKLHTVEEYTGRLGISRVQLSKYTKKYNGKTPLTIISDRIVVEAIRMLGRQEHNISGTAFHLGFDDVDSFTKFFRRKTRMKPSEFIGRMPIIRAAKK